MTKPIGPYSPVVRAGAFLFVSGQVGVVDGHIVSGGVAAETRQALENVRTILSGEGASLDHVVKTTVFLRHMRDFGLMNDVYAEVMEQNRPARSTVAVVELPSVALVEIDAVAFVPDL